MAKTVLIEQLHLEFYVARDLSDADCADIRRILGEASWLRELRGAIREVMRPRAALGDVRFKLTR